MCKNLPTYFSHILYRAPISPCTLAKILGHSKKFFSLDTLARQGNPHTLILKGITITKHCIMWLMQNALQDILLGYLYPLRLT